jgi:hypothetical protein
VHRADVGLQSSQIVFRIVGGPARNVAITRFDIRQELAAEDRFQVLLTVQNYTDAAMTVPALLPLVMLVRWFRRVRAKAPDGFPVSAPASA